METLCPTIVNQHEYDGAVVPSRLESYLVWRDPLTGFLKPSPITERGCEICQGYRIILSKQHGWMWCLCDINERTEELKRTLSILESPIKIRSLDELQTPESNTFGKAVFAGTVEAVRVFCAVPTHWLTIMGGPGVGKTHMLSSIKGIYGAWALYLTSSDIESLIFQALENENLDHIVGLIKRSPILLIDDLGSEYVGQGKDFVRSVLRKIIDYRYKSHLEYPTVIATNLGDQQLRAYDPRIADRILDVDIVITAELFINSWRSRK